MSNEPQELAHPASPVEARDDDDMTGHGEEAEGAGEDEWGPAFFEEADECAALLSRLCMEWENRKSVTEGNTGNRWSVMLPTAVEDPQGVAEAVERFERIITVYQQLPNLLHGHLEMLLGPLMTMLQELIPTAGDIWRLKEHMGTTAEHDADEESGLYGLGRNYDDYDADAPKTLLHHVCRAIYVVVKTVGEKCCTSYFSNDVKLYEDVFYALTWWQANKKQRREWEVRYCLLLWLSNLVLVPFSLTVIDSVASYTENNTETCSLSDTVLNTAVAFLEDTSKCREGAALLVARLLTRPDSESHRRRFFQYAQEAVSDPSSSSLLLHGVLLALAKTMKFGRREELAPYAPRLIPTVAAVFSARGNDTLLCKAVVKVEQRLALSLLRRRSAPWKYCRQVASLRQNLANATASETTGGYASNAQDNMTVDAKNEEEEEDDDDCLPDGSGLEDAIGLLLEAVSHKDTVVRWSAAKGVARICGRLPRPMAEDVLNALLDVFSVEHSDSGWHGGLLALAELCRRSILPPQRLATVVQTTTKGLMFDLSKGTYSVGSHVRDAACYVCWSIARAYNANDIEEHVHKLSTSLVVASLFDREVHVRRAAAAAFQEAVGRLGNFPDGIRLVTTMDFFSLASLQNAYLHVAPAVAENEAYRGRMLEELVAVKLLHWDRRVRCFAAQALGQLAVHEKQTVLSEVVPQLLSRVMDNTVAVRHGAILGIAELINHLDVYLWPEELRVKIAGLVPQLDAARLFRSRGGEFVRHACCKLLAAAATRRLPLPEALEVPKLGGMTSRVNTLAKLQEFFEDTWKQILEWLQFDAVEAYDKFAAAYFTTFKTPAHHQMLKRMLGGCEQSRSPMDRRGNILAIGALPWPIISTVAAQAAEDDGAVVKEAYFMIILKTAMSATKLEKCQESQDAESRRNAVRTLKTTLLRIPKGTPEITVDLYETLTQHMLDTLNDYASDRRGDVGSFVRLETIGSLPAVVEYGLEVGHCSAALATRVIQGLLKQAMEKLDKLRGRAIIALQEILSFTENLLRENCSGGQIGPSSRESAPTDESVGVGKGTAVIGCGGEEDIEILVKALSLDPALDKCSPLAIFTNVARPLLLTEAFASCVAEGLVVSAGSLSVHIMQPAADAFLYAFRKSAEEGVRLSRVLITIAANHAHDERVIVPLCVTLDRLVNAGVFDESRHIDVVEILRSELKYFATNIHALLPLVGVLGDLCRSPVIAAREAAWGLSLVMLASRYPKVRARMGTDMYTSLLVLASGSSDQNFDRAIQQLTTTQWDGNDATKVRGARDELYGALGLTRPSKTAVGDIDGAEQKRKTSHVVAGSYLHLVHEAGY